MKESKYKTITLHRGKIKEEIALDLDPPLFESTYTDKDKVWSVKFISRNELPKIIKIDVRNHKK